jgi:hypothetical protein
LSLGIERQLQDIVGSGFECLHCRQLANPSTRKRG